MMERQVDQMARLVDDLLDMSRITRGRIELRRERVELAPVVHQAVEAARRAVRSHGPRADGHDAAASRCTCTPTRRGWPRCSATCSTTPCKYTDPAATWADGRADDGARGHQRAGQRHRHRRGQLARIFDMFTQVDTSLERSRAGWASA